MLSRVSVRLGIVFGLIIFFTVAVSYFTQVRFINELLLRGIRQEIGRELKLNRLMLETKPANWHVHGAPDSLADTIGSVLDLRVTLVSVDGRVIGDSYLSGSSLGTIENHRNRPEIQEALRSGYGENIRYSDTVRENMLYVAVPLGNPDVYAVLRFAKPVRDIGALEREVRKGIEAALFWALFFSLLAGIVTAFILARPLQRLADAAEKRLHGDFRGVIPVHRNDEIGKLARGINYFSDEIRRNRRQEEWYRAVFSGIREAIIVTNATGEIILVNPVASRLFGIENAILASIKGYTETLLEGAMHDPEHAAAFLQIILKESEQLTALVNDVLDLSRIESGRISFSFAPVDLRGVVNRNLEMLRPAIEKKGVRIECNFRENLPDVCADASYLDIVVRNLLDNAVKYVDDRDGRIRISVFRSGDEVVMEIDDNGIGIAPADLDRIFERFYRVDKARSRQLGGTGLGLAIVKHIVIAHKGHIAVRSRINQGSTFSVTLPVSCAELKKENG